MEQIISQGRMRDGREFAVRRVVAPDGEWADRILPFLAHKSGIWQWQMERLLRDKFDELTFRSYLADVGASTDGAQTDLSPGLAPGGSAGQARRLNAGAESAGIPRIVANICTIEAQDVGLFGHVYTAPEFRGQSIARVLTKATMDDFRARGGQAMWLTTDFDTTPYRVYREHGFASVLPGDGQMVWFADGGQAEVQRRFAPGQPADVRPINWNDYATLNALACWPEGTPQRSAILRVVGQNIVEWSFLSLKRDLERGDGTAPIQANVLATTSGWPVGWAIIREERLERFVPHLVDQPMLLDVYTHPSYRSHYAQLIASLRLPAGRKVIALIDSWDEQRQAALAAAGFAVEGRLSCVYRWDGRPVDLVLMAH